MSKARIIADYAGTGASTDLATQDELNTVSTVASAALPKAGGTMSGAITTNSTFDGVDVAACNTTANAALPKAGGDMSGLLKANAGVIFNEDAADVDFRVEGVGSAHALFVQGSDGKVGIGTSAPADFLHIEGTDAGLLIENAESEIRAKLYSDQGGDRGFLALYGDGTNTNVTQRVNINSNGDSWFIGGNVGIGTDSPDEVLHLKNADAVIKLEDSSITGAGYIDFDGTSLQLNTERNPNTGTFENTSKSHAGITLVGGDGDSNIRFHTTTANNTTAAERMRILSGGGITFNGDTAAANALDDYEEGTFTPTLLAGGSSLGSLSTASGGYTKIGNRVYISIHLATFTKNSQTGSVQVGGLPFDAASQVNMGYTALTPWGYDGLTTTGSLILRTNTGLSLIELQSSTDAGAGSSLLDSHVSNSLNFMIGGNYCTN